jgi:hypothetical protein
MNRRLAVERMMAEHSNHGSTTSSTNSLGTTSSVYSSVPLDVASLTTGSASNFHQQQPVTRRAQARRRLVDFFMSQPDRFIQSEEAYRQLLETISLGATNTLEFEHLFLSSTNNNSYLFARYEWALEHGRRIAQSMGFDIRIKTSSFSNANGVVISVPLFHP